MWAAAAVVILITFVVMSFALPQNGRRLLLLGAVWVGSFEMIEIITALMIINWGQFCKPEDADNGDES
jgi:hypothetical protein